MCLKQPIGKEKADNNVGKQQKLKKSFSRINFIKSARQND